jgi:hypothetical protein
VAAALQVGAGDVVQHELGRLTTPAADVPAVQVLLDPFSAGGPFVQGTVPVVFGERVQSGDFADGLVLGPADGRSGRQGTRGETADPWSQADACGRPHVGATLYAVPRTRYAVRFGASSVFTPLGPQPPCVPWSFRNGAKLRATISSLL